MSDKSYSTKLVQPSPLFIGIDLGTSSCRAVAIDFQGNIKAQASSSYATTFHQEQTPEHWWQATQTVIQSISSQVNHQHIQSIAIDGTSSTVFLCDKLGHPISPVLMYNQHASVKAIETVAPKKSVVLNPSSGLAKVLSLIKEYPPLESFHVVHQADWIAGKLCQRFNFSDINNTLKTGFDSKNGHWPLWLLDYFKSSKINASCLPQVFQPGESIQNIHPHVANDLCLPIDVEIIAGTTDSTAAIIATGAKNIGDAVTSLGSTLVVKVISDIEINEPKYGVYSQPYGKHWLVGGASNSGGAVLRYYFNQKQITKLTQQVNPDINTNLNYYPLVNAGERFPINDPELLPKIKPVSDDSVFFQGLLEGIAEIELAGYKRLEKLGAPFPTLVQTAGGGAINQPWLRIRQNKLHVPVTKATYTEAAYGAALLAAKPYL
ncbi:MAG: FGGY-family carbohydrate kinase [Woeseiaceae bacterium]